MLELRSQNSWGGRKYPTFIRFHILLFPISVILPPYYSLIYRLSNRTWISQSKARYPLAYRTVIALKVCLCNGVDHLFFHLEEEVVVQNLLWPAEILLPANLGTVKKYRWWLTNLLVAKALIRPLVEGVWHLVSTLNQAGLCGNRWRVTTVFWII